MARLVTRIKVKSESADGHGKEYTGQFKLWQLPNGAPIAMKDDVTGLIIPWHAIEGMWEGAVDVVMDAPALKLPAGLISQ